jgi:hypothetical protein
MNANNKKRKELLLKNKLAMLSKNKLIPFRKKGFLS